ncbi:serine/threonine-protein kinase CtkA [Helicobacter pylori]|uniref:serine/threonine-protein kinase CtkA n=1 Tax=Helicobacter pylori TaxID=210 RepID=UPI001921B177|nr:serine/threonine-protein kinase CtkA [Helicobacter pylori]QQW82373.1 CtkA family protein [Helicobacter pylori]
MPTIDFTSCEINPKKGFGGANGNKISLVYNNELYMVKFPPKPSTHKEMSYTNGCFSEYVACHIVNSLGLKVQETLLGTYKNKIVVACKDFTTHQYELVDFLSLKNTMIELEKSGKDTNLNDVLYAIDNQHFIEPQVLKRFFWDMFIADTLLGNFDRHNGNWGFLRTSNSKEYKMAPIFDCGSCLYPQADDEVCQKVLNNIDELNARIYNFPQSILKDDNDKKINYYDFLTQTNNKDCLDALLRIYPRIDMDKIHSIIDNTPFMSEIHKEFLHTMLDERKSKIIDVAHARAIELSLQHKQAHSNSYDDNTDDLDNANEYAHAPKRRR